MDNLKSGFWTSQNDLLAAAGLGGLPGKPVFLERGTILDPNGEVVWFPLTAVIRVEIGASRVFGGFTDCHGAVGLTSIFQRSSASDVWVAEAKGYAFAARKIDVDAMFERSTRFSRAVVGWLSSCSVQSRDLAAANVEQTALERVSRLISNLHQAHREPEQLAISQSEIAQLIGIQRTTVSGVMTRLRKMNLVSYSRSQIKIVDADALAIAA